MLTSQLNAKVSDNTVRANCLMKVSKFISSSVTGQTYVIYFLRWSLHHYTYPEIVLSHRLFVILDADFVGYADAAPEVTSAAPVQQFQQQAAPAAQYGAYGGQQQQAHAAPSYQ